MFTLIIRAILIYLIILVVFRIMGKRQIGQLQPFEFVLSLVIADLATIPMSDINIPILHGITPLLTLVTVHFFLALCTRKSNFLNKLISGNPVIVINPKGIDYKALKSLNISVEDLFEGIRSNGFFSIEEIQYAIIETNGKINILPKNDFTPITPSIQKNQEEENELPITIISEGKLIKESIQDLNIDKSFEKWLLTKAQVNNFKNFLFCTIDKNGNIFYQLKNGEIINLKYTKGKS